MTHVEWYKRIFSRGDMDTLNGRLTSVWSIVDGLRVHTRVSVGAPPAELPPVVLVHGLSVSSRYMVPTGQRLAPYRRIYAPDLPGFGKSAHPDRVLGIRELTDALVCRMDSFGIGAAVLIGNSMGCQIIADLAVRYPQRITHAVLTGPTVDRHGRTMREQARRLLLDVAREPLWSVLTQARDYWACGMRRTIGTFRLALQDRIEEKLPHIRVPVLVVRGANDPIAPQRWVEEVVGLLPHGRLLVIPAAPHAVNFDASAALARAVLAFLHDS